MTLYDYSYSLNDAAFLDDSTVIVVGDYGVIMKSNDLGTTWRRINGGPAYSLIKTQFLNSQTGYILASYDILLRTDDGGENWFKITVDTGYLSLTNLYFLSPDTGFVVGRGGNIFKTVDGGRKWDNQQKGFQDLSSVTFVNDTIGFVCGASNTLFKTIDFGKTWQTIDMSSFGFNLGFMDVVFTNHHDGYLLGSYGKIIATTDTGNTWNTIATLGIGWPIHIYFVDDNVGYVIGSEFYKTTNGGATWNSVNFSTSASGDLSGIAFNRSKQKGIVVGNGAGYGSTSEPGHVMMKSVDAGDNWTTIDYLNGDNDFYDVSFIDDSIGYLFGGYHLVSGLGYKTTNTGLTWKKLPFNSSANIRECQFINKDVGFIVSDNIYFTQDGGNSWTTVPGVAGPNMLGDKMFFFNADTGIYATQGISSYLVKTTDRGINWDTVYNCNYWFSDIEFKDSLGFAVGYNTVLRSTDAGNTWAAINTFSTSFMKTVFLLNADTIFIGGAGGLLYYSFDSGLSWNNVNIGISSSLDIVDLYFYHDSVGIAITNNNGGVGEMFQSYDYGLTWTMTSQVWGNIYKYSDVSNGKGYFVGERGVLMKFDLFNAPIFPSYIAGDTQVAKDSTYTYNLQSYDGETVNWTAVNGNILYTSGDSIKISWPDTGNYSITVNLSNDCGLSPTRQFIVHVVDSVVGIINPMSAQDGIKVFPNPTSGIINLSIDRKEHGNGSGYLFNSLGLKINNFIFNNGLSQLNISELNSGLYFLVVDFNQKRYITKIIKE
ncbi:MAG: T9SS type A sorting domain-containing protein [Chitinophagaceae bacterium]|nr:T9SS type A sorting domain-containing protein [Chitinophagaceae bacterium]